MPVNDLIQFRRGTDWTVDPVLSGGEPGFDIANNILKIGDGVKRWSELTAINGTGVGTGSGTSVSVTGSSILDFINITGAGTAVVSLDGNFLVISGIDGFAFRGYEDVTTAKTVFNIDQTYNSGYLDVYYNGLKLLINEDYYANGGTTFELIESAASGDIVEWVGGYTGSSFFQDVGGSGTANYISKWKDKNTLTSGIIYDDGQKIGIGTNSPDTILHIVNPGTGLQSSDKEATIILSTESSGSYAGFLLRDFNNNNVASFQYGNSGAPAFTNEFVIASRQSNIPVVFYQGGYSEPNQRLALDTSGNAVFSNCNIGVNTTSPMYTFDVAGTGSFDELNINDAFTFPTADGTSGQFLTTEGNGNAIWNNLNIILDTSPQLGGNLDLNSNSITGVGNINISGDITANTGNLDVLSFNVNNESILTKGQLSWDDTEGTMDIGLTDNTTIHIGSHRYFRIRNETGGTLYKGQVVYATGVHSNGLITPAKYVADGTVREVRFMGLVLEDVNHNNNGYVIDFGHLENMDLDGSTTNYAVGDETWSAGDILYVHPTVAGKLTKNEPKHAISVAIILDAGNGNGNGRMFVRPTSYGHLDDNHDVAVSGATNGQFLQYNSVTDYWVPSSSGNFTTLQVNGTAVPTGVGINSFVTIWDSTNSIGSSKLYHYYNSPDDQGYLSINGSGISTNTLSMFSPNAGDTKLYMHSTYGGAYIIQQPNDPYTPDNLFWGISAGSNSTAWIGSRGGSNALEKVSIYTKPSGTIGNPIERFTVGVSGLVINDTGNNFDVRIEGDSDSNLFFTDGSTDRVGIGTSLPSYKLEVSGTVGFSSTINAANIGTGEDNSVVVLDSDGKLRTDEIDARVWGSSLVDGSGTTNYIAKWSDSDTLTSGVIYDDGTNVGIGTASPSSKLHVVGNATFDASSGVPVTITNTGTANSFVVNDAAGDTTPFVVDADGRVGIGTTPSHALDVASTSVVSARIRRATAGGQANLRVEDGDGSYYDLATVGSVLAFISNTSERMRIDASGRLLIGTATASSLLTVNGVITVSATAGSAGYYLPSLCFASDPNTGFGQVGGQSDSASVFTAGHERLRVDANGRVAIAGTTTAMLSTADDLVIGGGGGEPGMTFYGSTTARNTIAFADGTAGTDAYRGYLRYTHSSDDFRIATAATERLLIDSGGNVGIGTNSPSARLNVESGNVVFNDLGGNYDFRVEGDTDANLLFTDANTDRVGVGTNSPLAKLHVSATGVSSFRVESTQSYAYATLKHNSPNQWAYLEFNNDGVNRAFLQQNGTTTSNWGGPNALSMYNYAGPLSFGTNTTSSFIERMAIDVSGNITINDGGLNSDFRVEGDTDANLLFTDASTDSIGIGTSSPTAKLEIADDITGSGTLLSLKGTSWGDGETAYLSWNRAGSYVANIGAELTSGATNANIVFETASNTERMRIASNGNVGIGTTTPTKKLDVRYPVSGGVAIIKSTDSNDGVLLGDIYPANTVYQGLSHVDFSSTSSYMIMSEGTNTLISADTNGDVYIRGGPNNSSNEIRIYSATSAGIVINEQGADSNFRIEGDTDPLTFFVDAGANSIGIGTATPSAKLNVENGNVIFNDLGGNYDFRVEGDTDANLLFTDASTDRVGIGTSSPAYKLDVAGTGHFDALNINGAFTFPTSDGSANQYLKTDGAGNVSWASVAGGGSSLDGTMLSASSSGVIVGSSGWVYQSGQSVLSQGSFGEAIGDAQNSTYLLRTTSVDASWNTLLNNGQSGILLASNRTFQFGVNIVARRTDGHDNAAYKLEGLLYNDGYGCAIIGNPIKTVYGESDASWDVRAVVADSGDSNFLFIEGYGAASKIINWVAKVDLLEVGGNIDGYTKINILNVKSNTIP